MTEKEKAIQGLLYDANEAELLAERQLAKALCYEYNSIHPDEIKKRQEVMERLLGEAGADFYIEPPFYCDYGYNIIIGKQFYANHNCVILDGAKVVFGDHVFIGPNCGFYTAGHPLDASKRNLGLEYCKPIRIGESVWIGAGVSVLPGVSIGNRCVIGAGSVVSKDIPEGHLAYGNPCKVVKAIEENE